MPETSWLRRLLTVGAVLETGAGLAFLALPSEFVAFLLRSPLSGAGPVVARIAGGGLVALGLACWGARESASTPAGLAIARALLAYNLVACATLALARPPLPAGLWALSVSALHGLLAVALLIACYRPGRGQH